MILEIIIIICLICGFIAFKYSYDNYIHKGNYVFKTNLSNVRANMTSTSKDIEPINEETKECKGTPSECSKEQI